MCRLKHAALLVGKFWGRRCSLGRRSIPATRKPLATQHLDAAAPIKATCSDGTWKWGMSEKDRSSSISQRRGGFRRSANCERRRFWRRRFLANKGDQITFEIMLHARRRRKPSSLKFAPGLLHSRSDRFRPLEPISVRSVGANHRLEIETRQSLCNSATSIPSRSQAANKPWSCRIRCKSKHCVWHVRSITYERNAVLVI
jgi:hypothetical protein